MAGASSCKATSATSGVPDSEPKKKKRGGRRSRKMKERYAMTDMRKMANRMLFGVLEERLWNAWSEQSSLLLFGHGFGLKLPISAASLSQQLKEALGMTDDVPPPWLINMQRYDPPLSYPHLKILGLNAPLKHKHWGDLREEEEEEELEDGIQSVDTLYSTPTGDETPEDVIDLRKRKESYWLPLYQVMEEKQERIEPGTLFGTTHAYVNLQPEELEAMDNVLPAKYKQAREEAKLRSQLEDFSDMVAENEKKRKHKMQQKNGISKKKDFNF
ncbi:hypothetical protein QYF36_015250 [Acer negundo]|nr:hypothetical protein QYF36_015250 [Acer negundo]